MLSSQRGTRYLLQCWLRNHSQSFCSLSKEESIAQDKQERLRKLEEKYQPNTILPKKIGQMGNIHKHELVYIPKMDQQLNPDLYTSTKSGSLLDNERKDDLSEPEQPLKSCIYQYNHKYFRGNKSEIKESLQFALFAVVSLGAPAMLFGTMYKFPDWSNRMIGYMTFDWFFYWTQAGFMAFLVAGFFVGLKYQIGSWFRLLLKKIYGSTLYVKQISVLPTMNTMNIQYVHNTLFSKKQLSHNIELSSTENQLFYLKPSTNSITHSPDVRYL